MLTKVRKINILIIGRQTSHQKEEGRKNEKTRKKARITTGNY